MFAPDINPISSLEFQIFSRFIGEDWSLIYEDRFHIQSTKNLESKYQHGADYYLGQTLSRLEAKKRNLRN